jgi:hypothetical protein
MNLPTYLTILSNYYIFFLMDVVVYRYGEWSEYSSCTTSCGNGVKIRTRECFGDVCMGPATQTKPCNNLSACPSKWLFSNFIFINFMCMIKRFKGRKSIKIFAFLIVPSSRVHDAVVLKGSDLKEILSVPTWQILGFNFNSSGQWTQIPIQIDEMHYQKWDIIKHVPDCR